MELLNALARRIADWMQRPMSVKNQIIIISLQFLTGLIAVFNTKIVVGISITALSYVYAIYAVLSTNLNQNHSEMRRLGEAVGLLIIYGLLSAFIFYNGWRY